MAIEDFIEIILPAIIALLELMGIFVVAWSALHAFYEYIMNTFFHNSFDLQFELANGLATGLEFKINGQIFLQIFMIIDLAINSQYVGMFGVIQWLRAITGINNRQTFMNQNRFVIAIYTGPIRTAVT